MKNLPSFASLKGIRFNPRKVADLSKVVAPPYDVIDPSGRERFYQRSPYNIVRLILSKDSYTEVAQTLVRWLEEGILIRDPVPSIYLYEQEFDLEGRGRLRRRGFIGLRRLEPLGLGEVLPHEETLAGPKEDRLQLLKACGMNLSPLFGLYADPEHRVLSRLESTFDTPADIDLTDDGGVRHRLWTVANPAVVHGVVSAMEGRRIFLADGHHRFETAVAYRDWMGPQRRGNGPAPFDYVLMFFAEVSDPGLVILPTHRILGNVSVPAIDELKRRLPDCFVLEASPGEGDEYSFRLVFPAARSGSGDTYRIRWDPEKLGSPLARIGTAVVHDYFLKRILGLSDDQQKDPQILRYEKDEEEVLKAMGAPGASLGILLRSTRMEELREVVEQGHLLPPKTTFFYPKLLSGLVLNPLYPDERVEV